MTTTTAMDLLNNPANGLTVYRDGDEVRILATGLASKLGYGQTSRMLTLLPESEQGQMPVETPGGMQKAYYVTLPGMFRALGSRQASRIPDLQMRAVVEGFQNWVYGEVLPALVQEGYYATPEFRADIAHTALIVRGMLDRMADNLAHGQQIRPGELALLRQAVLDERLVPLAGGAAALDAVS